MKKKEMCLTFMITRNNKTRTKPADLQQICNRSVLPKTDQQQTNLVGGGSGIMNHES